MKGSRCSMLPNLLPKLLFLARKTTFGNLHRRVKLMGRLALHCVGHVAVQIQRNPDRRMPEPFRGDLRMHAACEQVCRVAMAEIMEPDARHILHSAHETGELVRKTERLMRLAIGTATEQGVAGLPDAECEQFLGLLALKPAQLFDSVSGQGDDAVPTILRAT